MKYQTGKVKTGGRKTGSKNKTTAEIKAAICSVYDQMGGDAGLLKWAKDNPSLFYERVWCKLLPREFKAEINTVDYAAILAAGRQRVLKARAIERTVESSDMTGLESSEIESHH